MTKEILDVVNEIKSDVKDVHSEVDEVKEKVHKIETIVIKNTDSLEIHIKRTNALEDMVKPLYEESIKEKAVKEFKKYQKNEFINKLKVPATLISILIGVGTLIAWIMGAF